MCTDLCSLEVLVEASKSPGLTNKKLPPRNVYQLKSLLLNTLLAAFKGKFGKIATILVRRNVQELVDNNPRIKGVLPKALSRSLSKRKEV